MTSFPPDPSGDRDAPTLGSVLEILESAVNYRDWIFSLAAPHLGRRVLEVGAGSGTMFECVADRELAIAVEIDKTFAMDLEERFHTRPNVSIICGNMNDPETIDVVRRLRPDSAMTFNVLEHIEDDERALRSIASVLERGDPLCVLVPAFPSIFGAMDRGVGHVRRYRRRELVAKMERAGFAVDAAYYVNAIGFLAWFVNGRILRSSVPAGGARLLAVYDRVVPVLRWLERRWHPPLGQSLFVTGVRR
ncbi:MAG TPA: methyltransferase domain-containing protein [Acidimicrobiales bacterium]|nr:methyltransferase domain-containing protein [Acidimicrobiales bacterium]